MAGVFFSAPDPRRTPKQQQKKHFSEFGMDRNTYHMLQICIQNAEASIQLQSMEKCSLCHQLDRHAAILLTCKQDGNQAGHSRNSPTLDIRKNAASETGARTRLHPGNKTKQFPTKLYLSLCLLGHILDHQSRKTTKVIVIILANNVSHEGGNRSLTAQQDVGGSSRVCARNTQQAITLSTSQRDEHNSASKFSPIE